MATVGQTATGATRSGPGAGTASPRPPTPTDQSFSQAAGLAVISHALLEGIGIPRPSDTQVRMMAAWVNAEQGRWWVNDNPLSTTLGATGSIGNWNSSGVRVYDTIGHGVAADISTLNEPAYAGIRSALKADNPSGFFTAVGASSWGTSSGTLQGAYQAIPPGSLKFNYLPSHFTDSASTILRVGTTSPTGDLNKVPVVGGLAAPIDATVGAASSMLDAVKAIGSFLTDTHNYLRIGESALGTVLLVGGIWSLFKGREGLALVLGISGYVFLYGGVKDVRPVDEIKAAFGGTATAPASKTATNLGPADFKLQPLLPAS